MGCSLGEKSATDTATSVLGFSHVTRISHSRELREYKALIPISPAPNIGLRSGVGSASFQQNS